MLHIYPTHPSTHHHLQHTNTQKLPPSAFINLLTQSPPTHTPYYSIHIDKIRKYIYNNNKQRSHATSTCMYFSLFSIFVQNVHEFSKNYLCMFATCNGTWINFQTWTVPRLVFNTVTMSMTIPMLCCNSIFPGN